MKNQYTKVINIIHCDRCRVKIYEGEPPCKLVLNHFTVAIPSILEEMEIFSISLFKQDPGNKGPPTENHFCAECISLILTQAKKLGEF